MEEISLQELFLIIRKRLWLIILLIILSIAAAGLISFYLIEPEYETFITLMVGKPKDYQIDTRLEYDQLLLNQRLVHTYSVLVKSRGVLGRVIDNLDLNMGYNQFNDKISVDLVDETELIRLTVTDGNPNTAAKIANETTDVFMENVVNLMNIENIQIIDKAEIPQEPVRPKPIINMAIGGILGAIIGIFMTFLLEFLDNSIKTPEDVENHLGLTTLGALPEIGKDMERLVSLKDLKSPTSEAFRTLRTNIQFSNVDGNLQTLIVTSSTPEEGKSTVTANLAGIISQEKKKVLLVDGDFRKPRIHSTFDLSNLKGLTNILVGTETIKDVVHKYKDFENLHIITSGPIPPNPAELMATERMKEFIEKAKEDYDMVIIDTPPVGVVTDASVLSTITDGVLLVAAVGKTDIKDIVRGKDLLNKVNANIIGVVLNRIPIGKKAGYQYRYYKYYTYYGEDSQKDVQELAK